MMLIPGETQLHQFIVPVHVSFIKNAYASYKQDTYTVLDVDAFSAEQDTEDHQRTIIKFFLTQEQSLLLKDLYQCSIQINIIANTGDRIVSKPITVNVSEQFKRQVIE